MLQAKLNICLICLASIVFAGSEPNGIKAESVSGGEGGGKGSDLKL